MPTTTEQKSRDLLTTAHGTARAMLAIIEQRLDDHAIATKRDGAVWGDLAEIAAVNGLLIQVAARIDGDEPDPDKAAEALEIEMGANQPR